jgi:hypothetical protein
MAEPIFHHGETMAQPIFHRTNGPYHGVLGTHEAQGDASQANPSPQLMYIDRISNNFMENFEWWKNVRRWHL